MGKELISLQKYVMLELYHFKLLLSFYSLTNRL